MPGRGRRAENVQLSDQRSGCAGSLFGRARRRPEHHRRALWARGPESRYRADERRRRSTTAHVRALGLVASDDKVSMTSDGLKLRWKVVVAFEPPSHVATNIFIPRQQQQQIPIQHHHHHQPRQRLQQPQQTSQPPPQHLESAAAPLQPHPVPTSSIGTPSTQRGRRRSRRGRGGRRHRRRSSDTSWSDRPLGSHCQRRPRGRRSTLCLPYSRECTTPLPAHFSRATQP